MKRLKLFGREDKVTAMEAQVGVISPEHSYLQPLGGLFCLQHWCNFDFKLLKVDILNDFYKEALSAWQKN